jgi:hypothetical protein
VSFEHYDLPGTTRNGDVHVAERSTAWFKDGRQHPRHAS